MFIKTVNLFLISVFIFSCSLGINNNLNQNYFLQIETPKNKYNTLLNFELQKNNKLNQNYNEIFFLEANVNFTSYDTLTLKGLTPLNKMSGILSYKLIKENHIINKGTISSVINYGNVTSLYGKNENETFVKQRIVKNLALKLLNKIKLIINKIEN